MIIYICQHLELETGHTHLLLLSFLKTKKSPSLRLGKFSSQRGAHFMSLAKFC